jgi:hypothetical protein
MKHRRSLAILLACGLTALGLLSLLTCGPAPAAVTSSPTAPIPPDAEMLAAGVWNCPDDLAGAAFVGSTEAETYYFPDCTQAVIIDASVRICFASADAARDYGYRPCNHCP